MKNEIILYQAHKTTNKIEVRIENETVWLNRNQIATLFDRDIKTIGKHINNALKEELKEIATVANFATVQKEGNRTVTRQIEHYNLDVIISVGYRVKSLQGIQFRIWANKILKAILLKGYAVNHRINEIENNVGQLNEKVNQIALKLETDLPPNQGVFFEGQIFDAYVLVNNLLKTAVKKVLLIDNYIDETVLTLFSKYPEIEFTLITKQVSKQLQLDTDKYNHQYKKVTVKTSQKYHDRFLIIDNQTYHIGASLKDLGKKIFAFSKLTIEVL